MNEYIIFLQFLTVLCWLAALKQSDAMMKNTIHVTSVWFFIRTAIVLFGLAGTTNIFEWLDIYASEAEALQEIFVSMGSLSLLMAAHSYYREKKLHLDVTRRGL